MPDITVPFVPLTDMQPVTACDGRVCWPEECYLSVFAAETALASHY